MIELAYQSAEMVSGNTKISPRSFDLHVGTNFGIKDSYSLE